MEYCLVEDLDNRTPLPNNCKYIALTIDASSKLDARGIKYTLLEDSLILKDVYGDTDEYLASQLEWFKSFDELVKDVYEEAKTLNINLPELYFYNIKYLVDQVILTTRMLDRFLEETRPTKIWFLSQVFDEDKFDRWHWFYNGESSFSRIIELICKRRKIQLEKELIKAKVKISSHLTSNTMFSNFKKLIPKPIKDDIKLLLNNIDVGFNSFSAHNTNKTILVIKSRDYVQAFCKDAVNNGYNIKYFKEKMLPPPTIINRNNDTNTDHLRNSNLMKWINDHCGLDAYNILKDRFNYLLYSLFPETLSLIINFINLYEKDNINLVLNYSLSTEIDFAAAMAAKISKSTKSVGFYHGMDAFNVPCRYFMEFKHFDIYFVSTKGEVDHIKALSNQFSHDSHPVVSEYPYLRNKIIKLHNKNKPQLFNKSNKPIILYLPIMRKIRLHMPIDLGVPFTMSLLKWHMSLIDYFLSRKDYYFIWKALLQPKFNYDPIKKYIDQKKSKNLTFSDTNIQSWLLKADRVICDVPSTAYFEACFAGKPVVTFHNPDEQNLRNNAYDTFGDSLKSYNSFDEGLAIIDKFLNDEPEKYIVNLDNLRDSDTSVFDVLGTYN